MRLSLRFHDLYKVLFAYLPKYNYYLFIRLTPWGFALFRAPSFFQGLSLEDFVWGHGYARHQPTYIHRYT